MGNQLVFWGGCGGGGEARSISSIQSVKVARRLRIGNRWTELWFEARPSSGSQPAPVGGGHSRGRCAKKWDILKFDFLAHLPKSGIL